jgi:hypothetical protein
MLAQTSRRHHSDRLGLLILLLHLAVLIVGRMSFAIEIRRSPLFYPSLLTGFNRFI